MKNDAPPPECRIGRDEILLFHYGELGDQEREAMAEHLRHCDTCRLNLADINRILNFASSARLDIPKGEGRRFALRMLTNSRERSRSPLRSFGWKAGLAAAVAGVVAALVVLPGEMTRPPSTVTKTAEVEVLHQLEFLQDLEVLRHLEVLEQMEPLG